MRWPVLSLLLPAAVFAVLLLAVPVQSRPSRLSLSFTQMATGFPYWIPMSLAFANNGTAYIVEMNGYSRILATPANSTTASVFFTDPNDTIPIYVAANSAAKEPNQLFHVDTDTQLYRLNTSSSDRTAHTAIKFDAPDGWGIIFWYTFTFVNNTLFAVVHLVGRGERSALMLLTFDSELDVYPVAQFLPLQQPANRSGLQIGIGSLVPTADGDLYVANWDQSTDDAVYRLAGSDIRAACASSKPGQWGTNLTVTPVLSGVLVQGGQSIQVRDVLPLKIDGRELLLLADKNNAAVLVWDPTAPLDPLRNPLSFPTPAGSFPVNFGRHWGVTYVTTATVSGGWFYSGWMRIDGLDGQSSRFADSNIALE